MRLRLELSSCKENVVPGSVFSGEIDNRKMLLARSALPTQFLFKRSQQVMI